MAEMEIAHRLLDFLNASPTPFHAVQEAKARLEAAGFKQLLEREQWELKAGGKYYFTRNFSTIIAFAVGQKYAAGNGFFIVGAHTDSPCPKLKPNTKVTKGGFLEVGVQTYGGGLWHTWFDRDLTIAGRVLIKRVEEGAGDPPAFDKVTYSHELVNLKDPIIRIPTLAIHLDKSVNDGFKINTERHLAPVLSTAIKAEVAKPAATEAVDASENPHSAGKAGNGKKQEKGRHHPILLELLASKIGCEPGEICDFELQVCDTQPSALGGALKEFIFSGRLDNLCMSFCSLEALIVSTSAKDALSEEVGVRMVALFDHEEVGSDSAQGAGSPVVFDTVKRVTCCFADSTLQSQAEQTIQQSFLVSADMAHCLHPNYMDKHEENHHPKMHKGLVIKHNANQRYATNAVTAFLFREIGIRNGIPTQDFVVRNDMPCGSTIGPILASGVGIRAVDIGAPQLSMHSIREMCGVTDVAHACAHLTAFFKDFSKLDAQLKVDA